MEINDIIQNIKNIVSSYDNLKIEDLIQIESSINSLSREYIQNNCKNMYDYNFDKNLTDYVFKNMIVQLEPLYKNSSRFKIRKRIKKIIKKVKLRIYKYVIPCRQYKNSFIRRINIDKTNINKKILKLKNLPQPEQRTPEWYEFRHSLITASSLWKIFGTQSQKNQLIYEKCSEYKEHKNCSLDSPLHWGQKYEPVSIQLYEKEYNTEIQDFGCIRHDIYNFIGASPDGINCKIDNDRFGRMLEIKNIFNREITGIPKFEYWIQMQIQMETCDLNECDFLETKFIEYESFNDFNEDGEFTISKDGKKKGIIMQFNNENGIYYEYPELDLSEEEFLKWEQKMLLKNNNSIWICNIYWKLEIISNILVLRNKLWFSQNIEEIKDFWNLIEKEKIYGFEHRAPKKRKQNENPVNKCLIKIEKLN